MPTPLRDAMRFILDGWAGDLDPAWRGALGDVALDFDAVDPALMLEEWEPVFPARRGKIFPGAPKEAHLLRAFDGVAPERVRCVILGQDPYPEPGFSTGRAFEAGNVAEWRELDKMFSTSVRAFMQLIVAARTGDPSWARSFADWPRLLAAVEGGAVDLEPPSRVAQRWVDEGVLLLNSSLTLSRFRVDVDPHQSRGHLPLWRPLILRVLRLLEARDQPLAIIGFGNVAAHVIRDGVEAGAGARRAIILRDHPASAATVLGKANPFEEANGHLARRGAPAIAW